MRHFFLRIGWRDATRYSVPLVPYFVLPILIGKFLCQGSWLQIFQAYAIWIGILAMIGLLFSNRNDHGFGWALIIALFTTVFAIPVLVLILRYLS